MALVELLGETLLQDDKEISTTSVIEGREVIGLYFSAHWCPPCKQFTPVLADFYTKHKDSKRFSIVFVSSDQDEGSFKNYFKDMPWYALPYSDRERKATLGRRFGVTGIPSLILLDGNEGTTICKDARSALQEDSEGSSFPWKTPDYDEIIREVTLVNNAGKTFEAKEALANKVTGLYFSAHWCPPCKAFTPRLVETYNKLKSDGKNFEIVFVSSDRNMEGFSQYFETMPWLAIQFEDRDVIKKLSHRFEISGIPSLIILNESSEVITTDGRNEINQDPDGGNFPWYRPAVIHLTEFNANMINEQKCLIWFFDDSDSSTDLPAKDKIVELMKPHAMKYHKTRGDQEIFFLCAPGDEEVGESLRDLLQIDAEQPCLILTDFPNDSYYVVMSPEVTEASISALVEQYAAGNIEMVKLNQ